MHAQDEEGSPAAQRASALVTAMQTLMDIECARRTRAAHARPLQLLRRRFAMRVVLAPRTSSHARLRQQAAATQHAQAAISLLPVSFLGTSASGCRQTRAC